MDLLELNGALATIDAIGCQKAVAAKIAERKGNYCCDDRFGECFRESCQSPSPLAPIEV